jgi:hypothetical protein
LTTEQVATQVLPALERGAKRAPEIAIPLLAQLVASVKVPLGELIASGPRTLAPIAISQFAAASSTVRKQAISIITSIANTNDATEIIATIKLLVAELAVRGIKADSKIALAQSLNSLAYVSSIPPEKLQDTAQLVIKTVLAMIASECMWCANDRNALGCRVSKQASKQSISSD